MSLICYKTVISLLNPPRTSSSHFTKRRVLVSTPLEVFKEGRIYHSACHRVA